MVPIVHHQIPPKMGRHGTIISQEERKRKRNMLHSIIRRIEEPLWMDDSKLTESDSHSACTIEWTSSSTTPADSNECNRLVRILRRMSQLSILPGMELVVPVRYNQRITRSFPEVHNRSRTKFEGVKIPYRHGKAEPRCGWWTSCSRKKTIRPEGWTCNWKQVWHAW